MDARAADNRLKAKLDSNYNSSSSNNNNNNHNGLIVCVCVCVCVCLSVCLSSPSGAFCAARSAFDSTGLRHVTSTFLMYYLAVYNCC